MIYTCFACGHKDTTALSHACTTLCEPCYLQMSDIRAACDTERYLSLRHAGKSDYDARRIMGPLHAVI